MQRKISWALIFAVTTGTLALATSALGADKEHVLHAFVGKPAQYPLAALVFDKQGNLYGSTAQGGPTNGGTIFEVSPTSGGGWSYRVIYVFKSRKNGAYPMGALVQDAAGNFYGTTQAGGTSHKCTAGCGTVFELSPSAGNWNETVLYSFDGDKGAGPEAGLVIDAAGNLYGTTSLGGSTKCRGGCGTVFELSPNNGGWTEQVLYRFTGGSDGTDPRSKLIFDAAGNLYGTTYYVNGTYPGTVFELTPSDSGWTETVLHTFSGRRDGANPVGELTFDTAGNLYGTTQDGGNPKKCGDYCGTVFEMTPSPTGWTERVIHSFSGGADGNLVRAGLVVDATGDLYGATAAGGIGGSGTVFEMTPGSGGTWTLTTLYSFRGGHDGGNTDDSLILDSTGNLYGTTQQHGNNGFGVVFEVER
jgi:uncharacterized repeat protein (TIGR03803 family)